MSSANRVGTARVTKRVGFTGTRKGLTDDQVLMLTHLLSFERNAEFHHGDCIGADAEAVEIARRLGMRIVQHPPSASIFRAFSEADEVREALPYLERNHKIVDECDILFACPKEDTPVQRSGTWATIRYANKTGKSVAHIWPTRDIA